MNSNNNDSHTCRHSHIQTCIHTSTNTSIQTCTYNTHRKTCPNKHHHLYHLFLTPSTRFFHSVFPLADLPVLRNHFPIILLWEYLLNTYACMFRSMNTFEYQHYLGGYFYASVWLILCILKYKYAHKFVLNSIKKSFSDNSTLGTPFKYICV